MALTAGHRFMVPYIRTAIVFFAAAFACVLGGCRSNPPKQPAPLLVPPVETHVGYYTGTPLSGPLAKAALVGKAADALAVKLMFVALDSMPADRLDPLGGRCRLIIARNGAEPVLPSAQLTQGTLLAEDDTAARLQSAYDAPPSPHASSIATLRAVLPVDVTATFEAIEATSPSVSESPRHRIEIRVNRSSKTTGANIERLQITLTLEEFILPVASATTEPLAPPPVAYVLRSETALLDRSADGGRDRLVFLVPMRLIGSPARVIAVVLDVSPGSDDPDFGQSVAECAKALHDSASATAGQPDIGPIEGSQWTGFDSALRALWRAGDRRAALVFLAGQTNAHICTDTALVADDPTLEKLSQTIAQRAAEPSAQRTSAALAWVLDDAAFEMLASLRSNETGPRLPPELVAVLTLYAGEAGRHPSSLEEITRHLTSRQDLENHLIAENLVYLTDASPAARVRAFDWLRSRGIAPAGYDPLGPVKQRREALDRPASAPATADVNTP